MTRAATFAAALAGSVCVSAWPAAWAQDAARADVAAALVGQMDDNGWIRGDVATLRGLDKITAKTEDFEIRLGRRATFGALTVAMPAPCGVRPPEETPETVAGLEIYERQTDGDGRETTPRLIFSGWMFASDPALNPLEHGVFDVWVLDCRISEEAAARLAP